MKTNKHLTLVLVKEKNSIRSQNVMEQFGYSAGTARSYLSYLARNGLLERTALGYVLTVKGNERLDHFDSVSCQSFDCPICVTKKAGHYTCPKCEFQLSRDNARILPEWNSMFFKRHAGVYCPRCKRMILNEKQAELLKIKKETNV